MNTTAILSAVAAMLGVSLVAQALVLRSVLQRRLSAERTRHVEFDAAMKDQFAHNKEQIAKLQGELATARLYIKRADKHAASELKQSQKKSLERELDATGTACATMPKHGFADTQPQLTHFGGLLLP